MSVKEYQIGDEIIKAKPFVHTLREEKKTIVCDNCFQRIIKDQRKDNQSKTECKVCLQMFYCCFECKQSDQRKHQKECLIYKEYYFPYLKHHFYRLILRTYLMAIDDKDLQRQEHELYDGKTRAFDGLVGHFDEIRSDENRFMHFQYIRETITYMSQEFKFELNYNLLYELFCRSVINHFDIMSMNGTRPEPIGFGIYIKAAVLNHSCHPNAAAVFHGSTLVLKAIREIKTGDEITISYVDLEIDRNRRQKWLKNGFYFDCQCVKCLSNDFNINYRALDQIKKELRSESKLLSPDWLIISRLSDALINICYEIYGRFHPLLLPLLIDILSAKLRNKWEDKQELYAFKTDLKKRVELIYGYNHEIYDSFLNCVQKNVFFRL